MRVLFVGFNRQYVNRSLAVLLRAVQANHVLELFGPGFRDREELQAGPERWVETHGPYDVVLFDSYVFEHDAVARRARPFLGDCLNLRPDEFFTFGPILQSFVQRYSGTKVFIANWDFYAISEERVRQLDESGAFVCDCSMSGLTISEKENAFGIALTNKVWSVGFIGGYGTDHWLNFRNARQHRFLDIPHSIGLEQTCYVPLGNRPQRFTVPGASYQERVTMYRFLTPTQRLLQLHEKLGLKLYFLRHDSLTPKKLRQIQAEYDSSLSHSRLAYVSGGPYRLPVRKYFEIPALGAVPVGQVVEGFAELGFVDGHNFIVAETTDDVSRVITDYSHAEAQVVASRARQLIIEKHSEPARARQLKDSFERIIGGRFRGSYWQAGEYRHH